MPLAVRRARQKLTDVPATARLAVARMASGVEMMDEEISITSSRFTLVKLGVKRGIIGAFFCFLGPVVSPWAGGGAGLEEAAAA